MKKTIILLALLAFVLIGAAAVLLVQLLSHAPSEQPPAVELEPFLAEHWSVFQLRSWDPASGALELDYPLPFSLEQMKKYAGTLEELRALPEGNRQSLADLKLALQSFSADTVQSVTVYGMTTDGEVAYTLKPDGSLHTCWEKP